MILSFARCSNHSSLWRKVGFNAPCPVTIEQRRIPKGSRQYKEESLEYNYRPIRTIKAIAGNFSENESTSSTHTNLIKNELFNIRNSKDQKHHVDSNIPKLLNAFYEFCRPYTMVGTVISVISISLLPISSLSEISSSFVVGVMKVLTLFLLMQFYVGGINQIYDVEIDKVNKPYLPLASGIFSMEFGITIVSMSVLLCLALGIMFQSPPLLLGILVYFIAGSGYSMELPFLRWKRSPFLTIMCIIVARAIIIPFATFIHIQKYVLGRPIMLSGSLIFTSVFACLFSIAVALSKDIPDIDGDRLFGFESLLAVRLGKERVFRLCISILMMIYGSAMGIGFSSPFLLTKLVTVLGHLSLASIVVYKALSTNLSAEGSGFDFYMFVWKLMYAEYFLIPFVR